jgi:hypothetical protein
MGRAMVWSGIAAGAGIVLLIYLVDPHHSGIYPACPFRAITGWLCPGCGSLRATHALLHGRVADAFGHNALLVTTLPVLGGVWLHRRWKGRGMSLWNSNLTLWSILAIILAWGVFRNVFCATGCDH